MITPEEQVLSGHCLQVCVGEKQVLAATFKSVNNSREYGTITCTLKFTVGFFFQHKKYAKNCELLKRFDDIDRFNSLHSWKFFMLFYRLLIFLKINFFERFFQECYQRVKSLDPDQAW